MPLLPTYTSERNIQTRGSAPLLQGAEAPFKANQQMLAVASDIAENWQKAEYTMAYTRAKNQHSLAMTDIQLRAAQDQEFLNQEKYIKEIQKEKERTLSSIDNPVLRNNLSPELDYESEVATIKVNAGFNEKKIADNKVQFATYLQEQIASKPFVSENERAMIEQNILINRGAQASAGLISGADLDKMVYDAEKTAAENLVYANPAAGREAIDKGVFKLDTKDAEKLKADATRIEKTAKENAEFVQKETQLKRSIELSTALYENKLTPEMVRDMQNKGEIDGETAAIFDTAALGKMANYPEPEKLNKIEPDYFIRLIENSQGSKTKIEKALKGAAESYAKGDMLQNQYAYFVKEAQKALDRQSKGYFGKDNWANNVIQWTKNIKNSFGKDENKKVNESLEAMLREINSKENPTEDDVNNAAVIGMALNEPYYRSFVGKKPGDIITFSDGVQVRFNGFVDGEVDIDEIK